MNDPYFEVQVLSATPNPEQVVWLAMHQDYSSGYVANATPPNEVGEIIVKRLLDGNRGHYGCYSADTEVLTDKGWLSWPGAFAAWEKDPAALRLLAVDIASNSCHFEHPSGMQRHEVIDRDSLYTVESQHLNFSVTSDHRMVVSHRKKTGLFSDWYFKTASEVAGKPVRYKLNSELSESQRTLPDDMPEGVSHEIAFKMAGFFFGDGLRTESNKPSCIRFHLRRLRKISYLASLGLPYDEIKADRYAVRHPSLAKWIHTHFQQKGGKDIPSWLMSLPRFAVDAFLDGLKNSDGTRVKHGSWCYDSSDKNQLDVIQALAHLNGFSANMTLNNPNEGVGHENHRPCWRLYISRHASRRVETCQKRSPGVIETWQPYSGYVYCATVSTGALMVRRKNKVVVLGNCLEHPQITFAVGHFPHTVMQQARTHRVGISFDVQSFRYTGEHLCELGKALTEGKTPDLESVFHVPESAQTGYARTRTGVEAVDTRALEIILEQYRSQAVAYYRLVEECNMPYEDARSVIGYGVRQHFVVSFNCRSLMHFLDLRAKSDAQGEIVTLCEHIWPHFKNWMPSVADWYLEKRWGKARLAP